MVQLVRYVAAISRGSSFLVEAYGASFGLPLLCFRLVPGFKSFRILSLIALPVAGSMSFTVGIRGIVFSIITFFDVLVWS